MNLGALALLVHGGTENWSPQRWKNRFDDVCPNRRVLLLPDAPFDPAEVHYAAVWKPHPGELAGFPNLRVIFNLGAGVDALMADGSLPDVPLVRVAVSDLTERMTEYVVLHVLMHHRQELYLRESQREKRWAPKPQWAAGAISVGIMGLGTLGGHAAEVVARFKTLYGMIRQNLPAATIDFISMKASPSREKFFPKLREANAAIKAFLQKERNASFIDIYPAMLDAQGKPREELFLSDRLHMKPEGYAIWKKIMLPYLLK